MQEWWRFSECLNVDGVYWAIIQCLFILKEGQIIDREIGQTEIDDCPLSTQL